MLKQASFWNDEREAPLLTKNRGFLKPDEPNTEVLERVSKWPSLMGISTEKEGEPMDLSKVNISEEHERIVIKDAERTFFGAEDRKHLIKVLNYLCSEFKEYAQAASYVTSFLLLHLEVETVVKMLLKMNSDPKYVPGYWRSEAVALATDGYVFDSILAKKFPEVHQHLSKHFIFPETYVQKWFSGLSIHVLPFEAIYPFFEDFLKNGYVSLFQFGLSLIDQHKEELLNAKTSNEIFGILRLENIKNESKSVEIVKNAHTFDLSDVDFVTLRQKMYDEKLRARMEAAKIAHSKKDDDSDDESLCTDDEDEEGGECGICEGMPEFYCPTCKFLICESCHDDSKGSHKKRTQSETYG